MPPRRHNERSSGGEKGSSGGRGSDGNGPNSHQSPAPTPLTFQSLQGVYQPRNQPTQTQTATSQRKGKERSSTTHGHSGPTESPVITPQPSHTTTPPIDDEPRAAVTPAMVVSPAGPSSLFTLNHEQTGVVAGINPAEKPSSHGHCGGGGGGGGGGGVHGRQNILPSDMGPLKPTGKRGVGMGLPSGSHIKRRPPSVGPRRGGTVNKGGRQQLLGSLVDGAGGGSGDQGAGKGTDDVNVYGSPSPAVLQMRDLNSPPMVSLGTTGSAEFLNTVSPAQTNQNPFATPGTSALGKSSTVAGATRVGREARPIVFDHRSDPSPAPSRPPRANRRRQQPLQQQIGSSSSNNNNTRSSNTPPLSYVSLPNTTAGTAAAGRYGRQISDTVLLGTPLKDDIGQRGGAGKSAGSLATLKRPPSGRATFTGHHQPSPKGREEAVQAYLTLCEELGETPNPDWVATLVKPASAFANLSVATTGPGNSLDAAGTNHASSHANGSANGSPLSTPHVAGGGAFTPKGATAAAAGVGAGRSLSGRRPYIGSSKLDSVASPVAGTPGSGRAGKQPRAKSPGTGRASKAPTATAGGKRSSSVGRVTSTNRPNLSVHSGGAKTPHTPLNSSGSRTMADIYLDRMTTYCEQRLRPLHREMEMLRQRRMDVHAAVDNFLTSCTTLEATEAAVAAANAQPPDPHHGDSGGAKPTAKENVRSSMGSIGSDSSSHNNNNNRSGSGVVAPENMSALSKTAQSLTGSLGELQAAVVRLLLKLDECAAEANQPLGGVAGAAATSPGGHSTSLSGGVLGSEQSQALQEIHEAPSSVIITPNTQTEQSATLASFAPLSRSGAEERGGSSSGDDMPSIPPLGIQDIFHKVESTSSNHNNNIRTSNGPASGSGGGGGAPSNSLPQTPIVLAAPQGFVQFVAEQGKEIAEELRTVRDTVREALETTPLVHVVDDAILQTPLFCPSAAVEKLSAAPLGNRRGSPRLHDAKGNDTAAAASPSGSGAGSKRSARAAAATTTTASRTPHAAGVSQASGATTTTTGANTPRLGGGGGGASGGGGGGRTPRTAGSGSAPVGTTPRGSKAGKATTATGKDPRRKSAGHDSSPRSKRHSTSGGSTPIPPPPLSSSPIFAIATDALTSQRADVSGSGVRSPCLSPHNAAMSGSPAGHRPLLVLGGGPSFAAAILASARSMTTDSLAATTTTATGERGGVSSTSSSPNAAAATPLAPNAKRGSRPKVGAKGNEGGGTGTGAAQQRRSASAGTGKRVSTTAAAATPSAKPSSASPSTGAQARAGGKDKKGAPCSGKASLSAADSLAVAQLEHARRIWAAVNADSASTAGLLPQRQPNQQRPAAGMGGAPSSDGVAAVLLVTPSAAAPDPGSLSITTATLTPPAMAMSTTKVFPMTGEEDDEGGRGMSGLNADSDVRPSSTGGGVSRSTTMAPLEAGELTAKPSQVRRRAGGVGEEASTPLPEPSSEVITSDRMGQPSSSCEPATEPAKQPGRRQAISPSSTPDDDGEDRARRRSGERQQQQFADQEPSRKLRLDDTGKDEHGGGGGVLSSQLSSSFLSTVSDPVTKTHTSPPPQTQQLPAPRAATKQQPDISESEAATRIARSWRAHAARRRIHQERTKAAAALATERIHKVQEGRVKQFLVWLVRRRRLRTALAIMRASAANAKAEEEATTAAAAAVPAGSPNKASPGKKKKPGEKGSGQGASATATATTPTVVALAAHKAAEMQARERRLADFVQLLTGGCTAADIPGIAAPATPTASGAKSPGKKATTPTAAATTTVGGSSPGMSSRDRFQLAKEQRKTIIKGSGASSPSTPQPPASPKPCPRAALPPNLPLLANGISTKAIVTYNNDGESFEVAVLHRLLHAPQPLLFVLRTSADRYPTVPPMGYARLREQPSQSGGGGSSSTNNNTGKAQKGKKPPRTESMSPDRDTSPNMPRAGVEKAGVAQDRRAATTAAAEDRRAAKQREEAEAGVFTIPFAKLRKYILYHAELTGVAAARSAWSSPLAPASPVNGASSSTRTNAPSPAAVSRQCTVPLSVRYESYIDANELGSDVPVVKSFTRPFEKWGTAHSMAHRIFTAAAIYAWKLLFSHTSHDDFKQRQLRTEEERQARLDRVLHRNRMILACYCVRSEREWLREASKDPSFVGQIWNPKKSMDPNDPDLDRHCRETYAFVEDFLFQCFPTANSLDDIPPFLVGAGIYFVVKEVFHTGTATEENGGSPVSSSSPIEACNFTSRYPELTVSAVDARFEDDDSNELHLGTRPDGQRRHGKSGSSSSGGGRVGGARRSGHGGGWLTEYQRRTVQSYELVDLIDRMSQWHYTSVANARKRGDGGGGSEKEDKKTSTVVLGGQTTHDDGFFLGDDHPTESADDNAGQDAEGDHVGAGGLLGNVNTARDDSQASFDALAATWTSAAGDRIARGAASLATPAAMLGVSNELRTIMSPMTKLKPSSSSSAKESANAPNSSPVANANGNSLKYHYAPTTSNPSHLPTTPPSHTVLSTAANAAQGSSHAAYHRRILSNTSSSANGKSQRGCLAITPTTAGDVLGGGGAAAVDGMANVAVSRVKLVKVPASALTQHRAGTTRCDSKQISLKERETRVFSALAAMARATERTFDFSCHELAVLYPKRFLVTLSEKLCFELLGLRLDLAVCEDLDCVE